MQSYRNTPLHGLLLTLAAAMQGPAAHAAPDLSESAASARCAAMAAARIAGGSISAAMFMREAPAVAEHPDWPIPPVPAHCRVRFSLTPTADSNIKAEVWLPAADWNGRFLGVGVGGYAGVINDGELRTAVQRGYAAAATDSGHGTEGTEIWARGHREKVIDYGHRAVHLMTVAAKELTATYYAKAPHHAYFSGCSNGGRQALMEASRYPYDYDGIIAGAPAADIVGLIVASFGWNSQALERTPIPASKLAALRRAVLAHCDGLDGASDELVGASQACRFEPAVMRCTGEETDACLTDAQIIALEAIYRGPSSRDGRQIYPGFSVGGEAPEPPSPGWEGWLVAARGQQTAQFTFVDTFLRDFVAQNREWSFKQFDLERDLAAARKSLASILNSNDPDLGAFAARGGKLILWHGWSDQSIPPLGTIQYYDALTRTMGSAAAAAFSRLYMAPGVQHCWLGPGPWGFNWSAAKPDAEPTADMAAALEAWVEKGVAPEALTAIRPKNPYSLLVGFPPLEIDRSGLLCPYPKVAKYGGKGSSKDAANYSCVATD